MTSVVGLLSRSLWTTFGAVALIGVAAILGGLAFDLSVVGAIGLYFVTWWILLFAILPVGMQTQADMGEITEGTEPGAPASPALRERAIWTSLVSALVFVGLAAFLPLAGL
ncbi:DUF1467 family protein [uncultured Enterovirga sp.]|uniref:DUF1467 family protein n=1 Tax=uncultured Enterovirga sp. TaxID=2026352 RepID=UPI0035CBF6AA